MVKETELIFIPVPSTGHLLVNIEFAKRLINLDNRINTITILQLHAPTSPNASVFARSLVASQPQIRLHDLPLLDDPPPLDLYYRAPEAYIVQLVKRTTPLIKEAVSSIVASRTNSRVAGLVLDFFCNTLIKDVGDELNLPSYIFLTCNARYLGMMKYLPDRHQRVGSKLDWSSGDEELPIPGFVHPVPAKFLPSGLFNEEAYYEAYVELSPSFGKAKGILVNSVAEIEPYTFGYFSQQQENYPPVYPVGPILSLKDRASPKEEEAAADRDGILRWLEDQPECSVVFLCFGSNGSVDELQAKEIAQALEVVGCRFLWSIRTSIVGTKPTDVLPEGFMGRMAGRGLVCGWAPQVEVLEHKAIGGFVSHCGWNSTLESLWFGVPVATWPMYAEQQLNAFTLVKELGLAVDLRMDYVSGRGGLVTCDEIARAIRSLMNDGEGRRVKVKEMSDAARKAVMDGGSSSLATARFIDELVEDGSC
nr:PREDICTED: UDP-glycosyltransferase 71C4-like [Raphanus sativus]